MFALVDCNNFYVSCERLFRPDLNHRPVVVLSNNDGCVISRSNDAKALGIRMGSPYFKVRRLCEMHQVVCFSSNYALYGDISQRVMQTIRAYWQPVEYYSIDEAFLDVSGLTKDRIDAVMQGLHYRILRDIGIPTSIGIGATKTLAKAANHLAKQQLKVPVYFLDKDNQNTWLSQMKVTDVWGVGNRLAKRLQALSIHTAYDLAQSNPYNIRRQFTVVLMRTVLELQGTVCQALTPVTPKQSLTVSRSFGSLQTTHQALSEALSAHTHAAWTKLRQARLKTSEVRVFIESSAFETSNPYHAEVSFVLALATDDIRALTHGAQTCLNVLFKSGIQYQKCGITLLDLSAPTLIQSELFPVQSLEAQYKTERLQQAIERVNQRFGKQTLRLASQGFHHAWEMKRNRLSPNYTTCWKALVWVYAC